MTLTGKTGFDVGLFFYRITLAQTDSFSYHLTHFKINIVLLVHDSTERNESKRSSIVIEKGKRIEGILNEPECRILSRDIQFRSITDAAGQNMGSV